MSFRTSVVYLIPLVFVSIHSKSIGSSDNNVTKRVTKDDPFPDWVPFKNKHGEELGEFLQVETVSRKPKKRLALPINFILRSVADADPEDYFDKSLGDTYGEDYSDKREWSDTFRPGKALDTRPIKHTELSEIDNVVSIITKHNKKSTIKPNTKQKERTTRRPKPRKIVDYTDDDEDEKHKPDLTGEDRSESEARKALILEGVDELKERHALEQKIISEKAKEEAMYTEERDRDNLRREIYDKYGQKSRGRQQDYEDYDGKLIDKYKVTPLVKPTPTPLSTESSTYESSTVSSTYKTAQTGRLSVFRNPSIYMIYDEETTTDSSIATPTPTSTIAPISSTYNTTTENTTPTTKFHAKVTTPSEKPSLNKSERLSFVPQDNELKEGEPTLFFPKKIKRKGQNNSKDHIEKSTDEHIASSKEKVPHDELEKLTDAVWAGSEAAGAETAPDTTAFSETAPSASASSAPSGSGTALDITGPTSNESLESPTASGSAESEAIKSRPSGAGETAASAPAAVTTSSFEVTGPPTNPIDHDVVAASTKVKELEEMKKDEDHEHERGGEKEHHSEHHSEHGESGKKGYEVNKASWKQPQSTSNALKLPKPKPWYYSCGVDGFHEDKKTKKGHHDKEDHKGVYDDHGGVDKEHHDERKHYGSHHHEEHGKKHAEYEESGKHSKGHSTKGSHDIHKKEEYEKNVEFFEEEGDSAEEEKHGGHHDEISHKKGGRFEKGSHDAGYHDRAKGDSGHFHKGGHVHTHKGHKVSGGHDQHGKHGASNLVEGGKKSGKKWIYHHGFPAKNANLVVIDRRTDQLYHGPQYYG